MTPPVVSVVVPSFNGAAHLGEALDSVLAQTMPDFEVIVVDDASTDSTAAVAESYSDPRLSLLRSDRRLGAVANWNRALRQGTGPLVKVMAQDDVLHPACLEHQTEALVAHPAAVFAAARRRIIDAEGRTLLPSRGLAGLAGEVPSHRALRAVSRSGTNIFGEGAAVLLRRDVALEAGGFRDMRPYVIDLDLLVRLLDYGPFVAIDANLASFRVSESAWSVALARQQATQVRALLKDVWRHSATDITTLDFVRGWCAAGLNAWMRRLVYAVVARRAVVSRRGAVRRGR